MKTSSQEIITVSVVNFAVGAVALVLFTLIHLRFLPFIPFFVSACFIFYFPLPTALGVLLTYFSFDGMIKIVSGYNPLLHVSSDILVAMTTARFIFTLSLAGKLRNLIRVPFVFVFLVHAAWVAVEVFNPIGLGFIAGLAAFKVYVSFLMLYFVAYVSLTETSEFRALLTVTIFILLIDNILSAYQFAGGSAAMLRISPEYAKPMNNVFVDAFFRPFGMSTTPGGAATWCFLTSPFLLVFGTMNKKFTTRLGVFLLACFTIYVLIISQVRASLFKAVIAAGVAYGILYLRKPLRLAWGFGIGVLILFGAQASLFYTTNPLLEAAKDRYSAISDINFIMSQRGAGVFESISYIWQNEPLGIGLSRVGAASNVFMKEIDENPYYGADWSFADNLYRAVTVELGIPGSIFYLLFVLLPVGLIFFRLIRSSGVINEARYLVAATFGLVAASIIGFWGSEGVLYLPECAYFWMFLGAAMRFSEPQYLEKKAEKSAKVKRKKFQKAHA